MTQTELEKKVEELERRLEAVLQLLLPLMRAEAAMATTVSRKWKELEGETFFRDFVVKSKSTATDS